MNQPPHNDQSRPGQKIPAFYQSHPSQSAHVYLIATPIGNLADLSPRALSVLQSCDEIWCEDTRHTQALLHALGLDLTHQQRLRRIDQHTESKEIGDRLRLVQEKGQKIGVVSDAGTPGVSDPGAKVVREAMQLSQIELISIPGPSAVTALVSLAGVNENAFAFLGFFPREATKVHAILTEIETTQSVRAFIFFESPHRIQETLHALTQWNEQFAQRSDGQVEYVFTKELTKVHETVWAGAGEQFLQRLLKHQVEQPESQKGEWCFLLNLADVKIKTEKTLQDWEVTLECLISAQVATKEAVGIVTGRFSVARNLAYKKALELSAELKKNEKK